MAYMLSFLNMTSIPNWITAIAAICAVFIAWRGLATWRKELKGKSEYETAKQVLKAVYKVREAFIIVRSPWISYVKQDNPNDPSRYATQKLHYNNPNHIDTVMKSFEEAWAALEEQNLIAQIEWGSKFQDQDMINPLRECKNDFLTNSTIYYDCETDDSINPEYKNESKAIIYRNHHNSDDFTLKIEEAIAKFVNFLRPLVEK